MDIAVPSRFACLRIEDDDFKPVSSKAKKKPENKQQQQQQQTKKQEKPGKQETKKNTNKPTNVNSANTNTKKSKKKQQPNAKQWEEWKEKDNELVNGNYEEDLQNAILLSKLEYEEKKEKYQQMEKDSKKENQSGKKKKNKAMSLNQFLGNDNENAAEKVESNANQKDHDFFERVKQEAKDAFTKEEISQKRKKREENIEEVITIAQYQEKLEREKAKNAVLQLELEKAKKEIAEVKARNKTLCNILGDGEMKDKADVLVELQRLNGVKNELTEEVTRLHGLLEQERSKVAALTAESQHKHKDKKQKKVGSNNK